MEFDEEAQSLGSLNLKLDPAWLCPGSLPRVAATILTLSCRGQMFSPPSFSAFIRAYWAPQTVTVILCHTSYL